MNDLFQNEALLFQSDEDEEKLVVSCRCDEEDGLCLKQVSEGDLTRWCFEKSPHTVVVTVAPEALQVLMGYLRVDDPDLVPALLAASYGGYDACRRVRGLLRRIGVPYAVEEDPVVR